MRDRDTMLTESELQDILAKERIVEFEEDIRLFTRYYLKKQFASKSGRIVLTRVMKSIMWQVYQRIKKGTEPRFIGNLRTFWYRYLKIVVSRIPKSHLGSTDPYDVMTRLFSEMVSELKLFKYEDFDFTDENWENRRIGDKRPEYLVFAEKTGWIRYLRMLHERFGVSILALGGFPSSLSSEYTVRDLKTKLSEGQKVHLIGIVDYDYSGHIIAHSFRSQLEEVGLPIAGMEMLIEPPNYKPDELELYKYPLPRRQKTKLQRWLKETGGIHGEAFGLESESMPLHRLDRLFEEFFREEVR